MRKQSELLFISLKMLSCICYWFMPPLIRNFFKQVSKCLRGQRWQIRSYWFIFRPGALFPIMKSSCSDLKKEVEKLNIFCAALKIEIKMNNLEKIQKNLHQVFFFNIVKSFSVDETFPVYLCLGLFFLFSLLLEIEDVNNRSVMSWKCAAKFFDIWSLKW